MYCADEYISDMKFSTSHVKRYKEIATLLWKYGRSDLVQQMGGIETLDPDAIKVAATSQDAGPEQLADDLEAMGPTYVKLGQILSSRPDLIPEPYLKALVRLQDKVKPFPYEDVEQIVHAELGVRISKAFSSFDPKPIAAASLGQVHSATLRNGRSVVVKVQRPGIRKMIAEDFEVLEEIAGFLDAHTELGRRYQFLTVLEEFRLTILQEINYEYEAQNLARLGENLKEFPLIQVPQPVNDYCTRHVLTMDQVSGCKITALSPVVRIELKDRPLAEELFRAYLKQILLDGLFHADPHPGNIFITTDGRIALLDLGMVGHTTPGMQENLLKLLMAVSEGNSELAGDIVIRISQKTELFKPAEFSRHLGQIMALNLNQNLRQMNVGKSLLGVSRNAIDSGLMVPSELTLLGKTLLQLDEVGKILDPEFDPQASIRKNVSELMVRRMGKNFSRAGVFTSLLETKDFVTGLPGKLNRILDGISNSDLEIKVKATDAKTIVDGFQKIANRITAGIILAALIVGASMLMRIQTSSEVFGYPALAIICFLAAAGGGVWLLISIFRQDQKIKKDPQD